MRRVKEKRISGRSNDRQIGEEILEGLNAIKEGRSGRRFTAESYSVIRAREKAGMTQAVFAGMLGVSIRTLQEWEQGRREPGAAARTLIKIAELHPRILRSLAS